MFWGGSVLARRDSDGLYYRGKVQQELVSCQELYGTLLCAIGCWVLPTNVQTIHFTVYSMKHSVVPGDKVIAPWEPDLTRYGPGTVIFGIETRDPLQAMDDEGITVNFWNGKTVKLSKNVAMWIPPALHARIIQELSTPLAARQQLCIEELCTGYDVCMCRPYVLPVHVNHFGQCSAMHTASQAFPFLESSSNYWYGFYCGFHCAPTHPPCHCLSRAAFDEGYRPPTPRSTLNAAEFDQGEVEKKCASQLEELDVPKKKISGENSTSSSSSSEDSVNDQKKTAIATCTLEDRAVNTDISLLKRPKSTMKEQPEWQYWRQSYPEPNHKKPGKT
uniref:DUF4537 domain-containing protein n=1 Tax=Callorhinchus milii TaxID=7868 RepID=A0A4W3JS38_CALMI